MIILITTKGLSKVLNILKKSTIYQDLNISRLVAAFFTACTKTINLQNYQPFNLLPRLVHSMKTHTNIDSFIHCLHIVYCCLSCTRYCLIKGSNRETNEESTQSNTYPGNSSIELNYYSIILHKTMKLKMNAKV